MYFQAMVDLNCEHTEVIKKKTLDSICLRSYLLEETPGEEMHRMLARVNIALGPFRVLGKWFAEFEDFFFFFCAFLY